jgi:hypothetical protein
MTHGLATPARPLPRQVTTANGKAFKARFAVVTLPVGVLQANKVAFNPPLPANKASAIKRLGMGTLNKVRAGAGELCASVRAMPGAACCSVLIGLPRLAGRPAALHILLESSWAPGFDPAKARPASALPPPPLPRPRQVILAFPPGTPLPKSNWLSRIPLPSDAGRWREFFSLQKVAGRPVVVAFNAGDAALYPPGLTDAQLVAQATAALRAMLGPKAVPQPAASWVTRWHEDPWSLGAYSVVAPGANGGERKALAAPVGKTLFFAGEAQSSQFPATVPGAYMSGAGAAKAAAAANPLDA